MKKLKDLTTIEVKNYNKYHDNTNHPVSLKVYGSFDTIELKWTYYVNSVINTNNRVYITNDISGAATEIDSAIQSVITRGKKFDDLDVAIEFGNIFKNKWESGRNISKAEIRDKKISQITDEE